MNFNPQQNHRILVIDDNKAIHQDFRKILIKAKAMSSSLAAAEAELRELRAVPLETREVLRQLAIEVSDWRKERELEVAT